MNQELPAERPKLAVTEPAPSSPRSPRETTKSGPPCIALKEDRAGAAIQHFGARLEQFLPLSFVLDAGGMMPCEVFPSWDVALRLFENLRSDQPLADELGSVQTRDGGPQLNDDHGSQIRQQVIQTLDAMKRIRRARFGIIWHLAGDTRATFDYCGQTDQEAFEHLRESFASELHDWVAYH